MVNLFLIQPESEPEVWNMDYSAAYHHSSTVYLCKAAQMNQFCIAAAVGLPLQVEGDHHVPIPEVHLIILQPKR